MIAKNYKHYQDEVTSDIAEALKRAGCQPILFIGSGFSRRYANGPSWEELLDQLAAACPLIENGLAYYKQKYNGNLCRIGSIFAECYLDWAWSNEGKKLFPHDLYSADQPRDIFLKHKAAELLKQLKFKKNKALEEEIAALRKIGPHAVITTNYDNLLESLFKNYEVIVGQEVFRKSFLVLGELFKIHGTVSRPDSMVLTQEDYHAFETDKKYLSAKLLTYFAEHPLLFVGYRASDQNIKNVLYDISRMYQPEMTLSPNIYILQWDEHQDENSHPPREQVLEVGEGVNVRIKSITASSFEWVFNAFSTGGSLEKVDVKALRALMSRTVNLIRTDIPSKNVEVNYETLEHAISTGKTFADLFGVTSLDNPAAANANHPYTITMLAEKLGHKHWFAVNQLIDIVRKETGFDMKASDNVYHVAIKTGKAETSRARKFSDAALALLKKVQRGEKYELSPGSATVSLGNATVESRVLSAG